MHFRSIILVLQNGTQSSRDTYFSSVIRSTNFIFIYPTIDKFFVSYLSKKFWAFYPKLLHKCFELLEKSEHKYNFLACNLDIHNKLAKDFPITIDYLTNYPTLINKNIGQQKKNWLTKIIQSDIPMIRSFFVRIRIPNVCVLRCFYVTSAIILHRMPDERCWKTPSWIVYLRPCPTTQRKNSSYYNFLVACL